MSLITSPKIRHAMYTHGLHCMFFLDGIDVNMIWLHVRHVTTQIQSHMHISMTVIPS